MIAAVSPKLFFSLFFSLLLRSFLLFNTSTGFLLASTSTTSIIKIPPSFLFFSFFFLLFLTSIRKRNDRCTTRPERRVDDRRNQGTTLFRLMNSMEKKGNKEEKRARCRSVSQKSLYLLRMKDKWISLWRLISIVREWGEKESITFIYKVSFTTLKWKNERKKQIDESVKKVFSSRLIKETRKKEKVFQKTWSFWALF